MATENPDSTYRYAYPEPIRGMLTGFALTGRADHPRGYSLGGRLHHPAGYPIVRFVGAGGLCVSLHPEDLTAKIRISYAPRRAHGEDRGDFALSDPLVSRSIMGCEAREAQDRIQLSFDRLRRVGVVDDGILGAVRAEAQAQGLRFAAVDGRACGGHALYVARTDGWGMVLTLPGVDADDQIWSLRQEGRRGVCRWAGTVAGDLGVTAGEIVATVRDEVGDGVD